MKLEMYSHYQFSLTNLFTGITADCTMFPKRESFKAGQWCIEYFATESLKERLVWSWCRHHLRQNVTNVTQWGIRPCTTLQ